MCPNSDLLFRVCMFQKKTPSFYKWAREILECPVNREYIPDSLKGHRLFVLTKDIPDHVDLRFPNRTKLPDITSYGLLELY